MNVAICHQQFHQVEQEHLFHLFSVLRNVEQLSQPKHREQMN